MAASWGQSCRPWDAAQLGRCWPFPLPPCTNTLGIAPPGSCIQSRATVMSQYRSAPGLSNPKTSSLFQKLHHYTEILNRELSGGSKNALWRCFGSCHISMLLRKPACLFCVRQGGSLSKESSRMCFDILCGSYVNLLQVSTQPIGYCNTGVLPPYLPCCIL